MNRVEPSGNHGPFDPRFLALRRRREPERLEEAPAVVQVAVQAWEGEGGAVFAGEPRKQVASV
jgi:hypothetical protein